MIQHILKLPVGTDFSLMSPDMQKAIQALKAQWPNLMMAGTREHDSKFLLMIIADADSAAVGSFISEWSMDWEVMNAGSSVANDSVIHWMADVPVYNDDGDVIGYERPVVCPPLTYYAGCPEWIVT